MYHISLSIFNNNYYVYVYMYVSIYLHVPSYLHILPPASPTFVPTLYLPMHSGVETASHTGHFPINLVNVR